MANVLKAAQDGLAAVTGGAVGDEYVFPAFDDLPKVDGMPQGNAWGFFDKDGKKDQVGSKLFTLQ